MSYWIVWVEQEPRQFDFICTFLNLSVLIIEFLIKIFVLLLFASLYTVNIKELLISYSLPSFFKYMYLMRKLNYIYINKSICGLMRWRAHKHYMFALNRLYDRITWWRSVSTYKYDENVCVYALMKIAQETTYIQTHSKS